MHICKTVHSLSKTKSVGIILTPWAMFVTNFRISIACGFCCSVEKKLFFGIFRPVFSILPHLKCYSRNLNGCIMFPLYATFVPNLTSLGLLSPETSFAEKKQSTTQTASQTPSLFCEHQCAALPASDTMK